jgi:hypothetical protein
MSRNGLGTYSLPAGNPVVTGQVISSTVQNTTMTDIATALTQSLAYDGQTVPIANLPMGGYKHTGAANGSSATDYATYGQLITYAPLAGPAFTGNVSTTGNITATGNVSATGTLSATSDFAVNTSKFTVAASSGNTAVAGTFSSTGIASVTNTTDASSTTTGSLINSGGIGIAKKAYIGDDTRIGTTATTGDITNTKVLIAGIFKTVSGAQSAANNTATTLFTLPTVNFGTFEVSIGFSAFNDPTTYGATAIIRTDGANASITSTSSSTGMFLTLSGMNVQGRQTSGSTLNISWSVFRKS